MNKKEKEYNHGYLLVGDTEKGLEKALKMSAEILNTKKPLLLANPDFSLIDADKFLILDARKIKQDSSKKSFLGKGRVFIIKSNSFTREAQNALLKTFEEPASKSYFLIITNSPENILETLRSRLTVLSFSKSRSLSKEKEEFTNKFLKVSVDKKLKLVEEISKEKEKTIEFLGALEMVFRRRLNSKEDIDFLDDLLKQKINLSQRASSPKMILEYICLVLLNRKETNI